MRSLCSFLLRHARQALFVLALALCGSLFFAQPTYAALTLTNGTNATTTPSVATAITGFQVVGPSASSTPVQLRVTNGTLSMTTTSGLVFVGATTGSTINFSGTVENVNNALATLRYTRDTLGSDTLEVSLVNAGEVFFSENGHLYKFVSGSYAWSGARVQAAAQTAYGATGYLATITSSAENSFVFARITGDGWIGATDVSTEDRWVWATGPETDTHFYQGRGNAGGSAVSGLYNNWDTDEPNDFGGNEDCAYMYASRSGKWNDFPCFTPQGYVVEFGADGALPTVVATNISIVTADVPAVSTLSPANSATQVSPSSNLTISFTKIVNVGTGSILIKKSSDDSTIESIDVTGDQVSGGGTTSITIDPSVTLADTTSYYVIIPATAFVDADENPFEGISSSSTWAFTTADTTSPEITSVATSTITSTSGTATWTTSEAASSKVSFGTAIGRYTSSTAESNTSSGVTSHSVSLSSLVPCTSYYFVVTSRDSSLNAATSTYSSLLTSGCDADSSPLTTTSTYIDVGSGGSTSADYAGRTLTVTAPEDVTASSSSVVIQIKTVANAGILSEYGRPSDLRSEVGILAFHVTALVDHTTLLETFDREVTISYQYTNADLEGIDESTIWLYHYHDGAWEALNNCQRSVASNTITCTTPGFSIFALFGSAPSSSSNTSGGVPIIPVLPSGIDGQPLWFRLNDGARETTSRQLTLSFNPDPVTVRGYSVSTDPSFAGASIWSLDKRDLQLPQTLGAYTVYLKFFSRTGHSSGTLQQTMIYHQGRAPSSSTPMVTAPTTSTTRIFTRVLRPGMTGEDVKQLQIFLNRSGFRVSNAGAGSPGKESTVYSTRTELAVKRFQEAYAAAILKPFSLTNGTGLVGSATLRLINQLLRSS